MTVRGPIASRDASLDSLALVRSYLTGDAEGFCAIRDSCEPRETIHVLAAMLAGSLLGQADASTGRPMPQDGDAVPAEVLAALDRLRDDWAAQYDRQSQSGG